MKRYAVTVSREGLWWVAVVDGLPGGATESRRLDQLEAEVRDLIAGLTDTSEDAFELGGPTRCRPNWRGRCASSSRHDPRANRQNATTPRGQDRGSRLLEYG